LDRYKWYRNLPGEGGAGKLHGDRVRRQGSGPDVKRRRATQDGMTERRDAGRKNEKYTV